MLLMTTPLHLAAICGSPTAVQMLIDAVSTQIPTPIDPSARLSALLKAPGGAWDSGLLLY